jgi:capsular polysaccharide biosynthesis protein
MKKWILKPPAFSDLLCLLSAWRLWIGGAAVGAIIASIVFLVAPSQYRAEATVLVDLNVEQAIPEEQTDLLKDTYLAREAGRLVEIAKSDQTLQRVSEQTGLSLAQLRDGRLQLSQPSDGGWHFLAKAPDPENASALAASWARAFIEEIQSEPAWTDSLLEVNLTQGESLPVQKAVSLGIFVFGGALLGICLFMLVLLFVDRKVA